MIFDEKLMFLDEESVQDYAGGALGKVLDLGAESQFRGRQCYVAIEFLDATTATGDPTVSFALETSRTDDFLDERTIPLSIPELKKADMGNGAHYYAPCPLYALRFARLKMDVSSPITCAVIMAGIVLDPQI